MRTIKAKYIIKSRFEDRITKNRLIFLDNGVLVIDTLILTKEKLDDTLVKQYKDYNLYHRIASYTKETTNMILFALNDSFYKIGVISPYIRKVTYDYRANSTNQK